MVQKTIALVVLVTFLGTLVASDLVFVYAQTGQSVKRIAILPFHNMNEEAMRSDLGNTVTRMLTTEVTNRNVFQVVERSSVEQAVGQLNLQASRTVDPRTAKNIGELLGVEVYIYGSVAQLGASFGIDIQLVETQQGSVLFSDRLTSQTGTDLNYLITGVAARMEQSYMGSYFKTVTFNSEPSGADVYIDDVEKGKTPLSVELTRGQHNIIVGKAGYRAWIQAINVGEGENNYTIALSPTTSAQPSEQKPAAEVKAEKPPEPKVVTQQAAPRKKGSKTALYVVAGALVIGGGVAALLLTQKKDESNNSRVSITVSLP